MQYMICCHAGNLYLEERKEKIDTARPGPALKHALFPLPATDETSCHGRSTDIPIHPPARPAGDDASIDSFLHLLLTRRRRFPPPIHTRERSIDRPIDPTPDPPGNRPTAGARARFRFAPARGRGRTRARMGAWMSRVWFLMFPAREYKLVVVGLDNAGKTTTLYKLHLGEAVTAAPTIGSNVEEVVFKNLRFEVSFPPSPSLLPCSPVRATEHEY
jgi:hypothetical protein